MKKLFACGIILSGFVFASAHAAQGEYWEITTKMEMQGMPFAMPATTVKVCMPPGGEKDPQRTQDKNSNCEISDVKTSGNKVSFKGKCVEKEGTMYLDGESTHERDSYRGTMHMSGKSEGRDMDMKTSYSGKRVGGSCDPEEMTKKAQAYEKESQAQMGKLCDTSGFNASRWMSSAHMYIGPKPACPGKQEALCKAVRNDVPRDTQAFEMLMQQEKTGGTSSIIKTCNVNLDSMKKTLCKENARRGPLSFLEANCPAEAKTFRELARKREACEGRGYTSGEKMKECMGGALVEEEPGSDSASDPRKANAEAEKQDAKSSSITGNPTADQVLEGAKKLKGLFKF
ncbi:MAG: hypothetical protein FD134_2510 [Gallionellaceae bacterium]|nr:MAG: hypothetical protein FD134_2510 [Gallionellaceae bacterium]